MRSRGQILAFFMANTLTISSKLSPFPYAAAAIAVYTEKSEIVYDESVDEPVLILNGSTVAGEQDIVRALSTAGGLSEDSEKVSLSS